MPFLGACYDLGRPNVPCLVSPYLQNGNIRTYLVRNPDADRISLVRTALLLSFLIELLLQLAQVAAALNYLHHLHPPVVHGDLKGVRFFLFVFAGPKPS